MADTLDTNKFWRNSILNYIPGKENVLSDTLSRLVDADTESEVDVLSGLTVVDALRSEVLDDQRNDNECKTYDKVYVMVPNLFHHFVHLINGLSTRTDCCVIQVVYMFHLVSELP